MSHVTGINLLTCVNWDGWQDLMDCIEVKKMDIYVLYVYGHKMAGHLICPPPPNSVDGFIFPVAKAPSSPLSSPWPVKDSNKLASIVKPKVPSMRRRSTAPKVWW